MYTRTAPSKAKRDGEVLKSCGADASARVKEFVRHGVVVRFDGDSVLVNSQEWTLEKSLWMGIALDRVARNTDELFEVWFYRKNKRVAGFVTYLQFRNGRATCADAIQMVGVFKAL